MNKAELAAAIAEKTGLSRKKADEAIKAFVETVTDEIGKGNDVTLVGFGTFTITERAARKGKNPTTGAEIDIPAKTVPKFRAGQALKNAAK